MTPDIPILSLTGEACVIVKPAGRICEEGDDSLLPLLRQKLAKQGQKTDLFPVHRLDRATGGVMVYARTKESAAYFSRLAAENGLHKIYLAKLGGIPPQPRGELRDLLFHDRQKNKTYAVRRQRKGVREAALQYIVLEENEDEALAAVRLLTGRTHQIRAQFASRGLPLLGDRRYGGRAAPAFGLWAHSLGFRTPDGREVRFYAPAPFAPAYNQSLFSLFEDKKEDAPCVTSLKLP